MKVMICTIFAIVLCQADALTLRGQPSLLQVGSSLPVNSSQSEQEDLNILEDMENKMMHMAKSGKIGTPLKQFADLIKPHLKSMEKAINDTHMSEQTILNNLFNAFDTCAAAKAKSGTGDQLLISKASLSQKHKKCRKAESTAAANYAKCPEMMKIRKEAKTTMCVHYGNLKKVPSLSLVPKPLPSEKYRPWLLRVKAWVIAELNKLETAEKQCNASTKLYDDTKEECEGSDGNGGLKKLYVDKKSTCDSDQIALETTSCSYAAKVEGTCSQYGTCFSSAKKAYDAGTSNVSQIEGNLYLEYRLVKRLMCFCEQFTGANEYIDADKIEECKKKLYDVTHLKLTVPSVPTEPGTCWQVAEKPCTAKYLSTEYGDLPSDAPAATCKACPPSVLEEDVTCDFAIDGIVTKVYIDGKDKTGSMSGSLSTYPPKKSILFKSDAKKLAFQVSSPTQGCLSTGFAISCRSKATAWTISSNSKKGWKVFSVKAGDQPSSISPSQFPPVAGGKQWYEIGYPEGTGFKTPKSSITDVVKKIIKTDGKNTKDFCGADSDITKNHWFFTYDAQAQGGDEGEGDFKSKCAQGGDWSYILDYTDKRGVDDLPNQVSEVAKGFISPNAFYIGNAQLNKLKMDELKDLQLCFASSSEMDSSGKKCVEACEKLDKDSFSDGGSGCNFPDVQDKTAKVIAGLSGQCKGRGTFYRMKERYGPKFIRPHAADKRWMATYPNKDYQMFRGGQWLPSGNTGTGGFHGWGYGPTMYIRGGMKDACSSVKAKGDVELAFYCDHHHGDLDVDTIQVRYKSK